MKNTMIQLVLKYHIQEVVNIIYIMVVKIDIYLLLQLEELIQELVYMIIQEMV